MSGTAFVKIQVTAVTQGSQAMLALISIKTFKPRHRAANIEAMTTWKRITLAALRKAANAVPPAFNTFHTAKPASSEMGTGTAWCNQIRTTQSKLIVINIPAMLAMPVASMTERRNVRATHA
jgi:hypothetical protein